jgi:protein-tyrosine sulfotransferase
MRSEGPAISGLAAHEGPIFILGILQRSGTNFLADLLYLHPDCSALPAPIREDFLVHHADLLATYAKSTSHHWQRWGAIDRLEDQICQSLGDGLVSFLSSQIRAKRLVTKTPSVHNLRYVFRVFPHACILILVRDGRAVVESRVKTFGEPYESAMRKWGEAAAVIHHFEQATRDSACRYLIVRYEDLWNDVKGELQRIFAFLGLDVTTYNFDAAVNLPVRGSSVFHGPGEQTIHWKPIQKTANFDPLQRWSHWNRVTHERFNWLVGAHLVSFGYQEKKYVTNKLLWRVWNRVADMRWWLRSLFLSTSYELKRILKWTFGAERISKIRHILLNEKAQAPKKSLSKI